MAERAGDPRDDYRDLGFDVEKHREAIGVMSSCGFGGETIWAGLKARDLVHVRMRAGKFAIRLADDLDHEEESQPGQRCIVRQVIFQSRDSAATGQVRAEVESYFLRHFPGRCLSSSPESDRPASGAEVLVYVALFAPIEGPLPG